MFAIRLKFFSQQSHTITLAQIFDVCRVQQQQLPWRRSFTRCVCQNPKTVTPPKNVTATISKLGSSFETAIYTQRLLQFSVNLKGVGASCVIQLSESCRLARRREDWKRPWSLFSTLRLLIKSMSPGVEKKALKKSEHVTRFDNFDMFSSRSMRKEQKRDWFSTRFRQIFGTGYSPKNRWTMPLLMAELWKISVVCTSRLGWRKNFPPSRHPTDLSTLFLLASYRGHLRVERRKERTSCPSHASDKTSCGRKWRTSKSLFQHSLRSGYSVGRRFHLFCLSFFSHLVDILTFFFLLPSFHRAPESLSHWEVVICWPSACTSTTGFFQTLYWAPVRCPCLFVSSSWWVQLSPATHQRREAVTCRCSVACLVAFATKRRPSKLV